MKITAQEKALAKSPGVARMVISRFQLLGALKAGRVEVGYAPLFLWIEPTNRCNLRCPMCPQSEGLKRRTGVMPLDRFARIVEQAAGRIQVLSLHFGGEPLLNPELPAMIRMSAEHGIPTIIHSNGTMLTREKSREIIQAGLAQIVFSFDAVPRDSYAEKRPPAKFDDTLEKIRGFLDEKKRLGRRFPMVTIKSIVFHGQADTAAAAAELEKLFAGLPVDRFTVELAHTFAGDFARQVLVESRYNVLERNEMQLCALPWYGFAVAWDGTAYACCNDLNGEYPLGDLNTQNLMEVWNGMPMQELRKRLYAREAGEIPLCSSCDAAWRKFGTKQVVVEGAKFIAKHLLRKTFSGVPKA